jgi:hypothetical protein
MPRPPLTLPGPPPAKCRGGVWLGVAELGIDVAALVVGDGFAELAVGIDATGATARTFGKSGTGAAGVCPQLAHSSHPSQVRAPRDMAQKC